MTAFVPVRPNDKGSGECLDRERSDRSPCRAVLSIALIVAAAADGDQKATFRAGNNPVESEHSKLGGFIGQWDDRQWKTKEVTIPAATGAAGTRRHSGAVATSAHPDRSVWRDDWDHTGL